MNDLPVRLREDQTQSWRLDEANRAHAARALAAFGSRKSRVAKALGVGRETLEKLL